MNSLSNFSFIFSSNNSFVDLLSISPTFVASHLELFLSQARPNPQNILIVVLLGVLGLFALICLAVLWNFGSLWLQAMMSGADVSMSSLIGTYLRQVRSSVVVNAKIMAAQAGCLETVICPGCRVLRRERLSGWLSVREKRSWGFIINLGERPGTHCPITIGRVLMIGYKGMHRRCCPAVPFIR